MKYPKHIWDQLKNLTADDLVHALTCNKIGFKKDREQGYSSGARQVYKHPDGRRVAIDYHPHKTYRPNLLKHLLADTGWSIEDMKELGLIQ